MSSPINAILRSAGMEPTPFPRREHISPVPLPQRGVPRYSERMKRLLAAALVWILSAGSGVPVAAQAQAGGAGRGAEAFILTLLHVGDTHSKLEPAETRLAVDGASVVAELGGFPRLMSAVSAARAAEKNTLFLHAGDMFQGSLYFTRYQGAADTDFWNLMGLDAATLGNHEFDRGPALLQSNLLAPARFAVVACNVDASEASGLDRSRIQPFVILRVGGQEIGVVGLTTTETPYISSPGAAIRFRGAEASVQAAVDALRGRGVNKIVLLSHQGYDQDLKLARRLSGVDVIVGGHSHTLLGDFGPIGLRSWGPYPAVAADKDGGRVLVVAAYEGAKVLGVLRVAFDESGAVISHTAAPRLVVGDRLFRFQEAPDLGGRKKRIEARRDDSGAIAIAEYDGGSYVPVPAGAQAEAWRAMARALLDRLASEPAVALVGEDPQGAQMLAVYADGVARVRGEIVARADEEMRRGLNRGPGPLVADSMAWRTGAQVALNNPGGVRSGIADGPISVAEVYELLPFGNTLVTLPLSGAELVKVLEEAVSYQVSRYGPDLRAPYVYVSGIAFVIDLGNPSGLRVRDVRVKGPGGAYAPIAASERYQVVVNSFMAAGGDRYDTLEAAGGKYDTGFGDAEAFLDYIRGKRLRDDREERVSVMR